MSTQFCNVENEFVRSRKRASHHRLDVLELVEDHELDFDESVVGCSHVFDVVVELAGCQIQHAELVQIGDIRGLAVVVAAVPGERVDPSTNKTELFR